MPAHRRRRRRNRCYGRRCTGVRGDSQGEHGNPLNSSAAHLFGAPPPAATHRRSEAGIDSARRRVHGCERPIRLRGATKLVNPATGEVRTLYASAQELDGTTWVPVREPPRRRLRAMQPPVPGRRLAAGHHRPGWRQGHPRRGRRAPVHVRRAHRPLVRPGPRPPRQGTLPGPPRQAGLSARPAAVVQRPPPRERPASRHAAVRGLLRLHRARGLAVARARAVAPPVRLDGPRSRRPPRPPITTVLEPIPPAPASTPHRRRPGRRPGHTRTITDTADRDRRSTRTAPEQVGSYLASTSPSPPSSSGSPPSRPAARRPRRRHRPRPAHHR